MVLEQSSVLLLCGSHSWPGVEPGTVLRGPALSPCAPNSSHLVSIVICLSKGTSVFDGHMSNRLNETCVFVLYNQV